jgi:hypothetical protein
VPAPGCSGGAGAADEDEVVHYSLSYRAASLHGLSLGGEDSNRPCHRVPADTCAGSTSYSIVKFQTFRMALLRIPECADCMHKDQREGRRDGY